MNLYFSFLAPTGRHGQVRRRRRRRRRPLLTFNSHLIPERGCEFNALVGGVTHNAHAFGRPLYGICAVGI